MEISSLTSGTALPFVSPQGHWVNRGESSRVSQVPNEARGLGGGSQGAQLCIELPLTRVSCQVLAKVGNMYFTCPIHTVSPRSASRPQRTEHFCEKEKYAGKQRLALSSEHVSVGCSCFLGRGVVQLRERWFEALPGHGKHLLKVECFEILEMAPLCKSGCLPQPLTCP